MSILNCERTYPPIIKVQIDIFEIDPLHKVWRKFYLRYFTLLRDLCLQIPISTTRAKYFDVTEHSQLFWIYRTGKYRNTEKTKKDV